MAYNILIVDDSGTMRQVIGKALRMSGLELGSLLEAENGRRGLEILREQWVDLVFSDLNMPVMGGMEMLDEMKKDESLREIPVVVISTEGSSARIGELQGKGIDGFLRKPFLPDALKKTITSILGADHE